MRNPAYRSDWPESWKVGHRYDQLEFFGDAGHPGYTYAYRRRFEATIDAVVQRLPAAAKVLDIAAAQGNFTLALAERGYDVTWNDLRADLAGYVRLKHEAGLVRFAPGNCFELTFPHLFDAAVVTEIIEHVAHPDEFLRKVAALVKPGGLVVMTTPNGTYFRNTLPRFSDCPDPSQFEAVQFKPDSDGHLFLLHTDEVVRLAEDAGLVLDELRLFTNPLTAGCLKTAPLLRWLPRAVVDAVESLTSVKRGLWLSKVNLHTLAVYRRAGLSAKLNTGPRGTGSGGERPWPAGETHAAGDEHPGPAIPAGG